MRRNPCKYGRSGGGTREARAALGTHDALHGRQLQAVLRPPTLLDMPNIRVVLAVLVLVLATVAAGCGGGETASGGGEPASAVPRDASIYLEATVRPEGSLRDDALAAAGKVLQH